MNITWRILMWIRNDMCLYNLDQFSKVYVSGVKIIGIDLNNVETVLGEFWTKKECIAIYRSIMSAIRMKESIIFVKNTRNGTVCLKRK